MDKNQRLGDIVNILRFKKFVKIKDLRDILKVSEMTIRRDLILLSRENLVNLVPGGALLKPAVDDEKEKENYVVTHEETVRTREKIRIGKQAVSLIEPDETIILDIGSTTEFVAEYLPDDVPLSVLCYTINVLMNIYKKKFCKIIFPGGYFHPDELMFESPEAISLIRRIRADKAFVSAGGVHKDLGVTTVYPYELEIKRSIMQAAKTKILLVDSTKFNKTKSVYFADLKDFDIVITDSEINEEYREHILKLGIELFVV